MRLKVKSLAQLDTVGFLKSLELIQVGCRLLTGKTIDRVHVPVIFEMFDLRVAQYLAHESLLIELIHLQNYITVHPPSQNN